jgi:hypothetical protein
MSAKEYNEAKQEKRRRRETTESSEFYVLQVYRASDFKRPRVRSKINLDSDSFLSRVRRQMQLRTDVTMWSHSRAVSLQAKPRRHIRDRQYACLEFLNWVGGASWQLRNELSFQGGHFVIRAYRNEVLSPHFTERSSYIPAFCKLTQTRTRMGRINRHSGNNEDILGSNLCSVTKHPER